jgi:hypothetical protein
LVVVETGQETSQEVDVELVETVGTLGLVALLYRKLLFFFFSLSVPVTTLKPTRCALSPTSE